MIKIHILNPKTCTRQNQSNPFGIKWHTGVDMQLKKNYPYTKLNTSKGVIRKQELSLATPEKIETALQKRGKDYKRVTIWRNESIWTFTYILTFDKQTIPKEIRIGFTEERVENYILAPLSALNVKNSDILKTFAEDTKSVGNVVTWSKPHWEWLQKCELYKLPWRTPYLFKDLWYLQKRKGNKVHETLQKYTFPRSKKNRGKLYGKNNICQCSTKSKSNTPGQHSHR